MGIIGIVAALTIPQLIKNYQAHILRNQLKTAYADLNNASRIFMLHNDISVSEYASLNGTKKAIQKFKKEFTTVVKDDDLDASSVDDDGKRVEPYKMYLLTGAEGGWLCDNSGYFWDAQVRTISFDDEPAMGQNGPKVCIDINGIKKPNKFGVDYFVFMFTVDGLVIPFGQAYKNNPRTFEDGGNLWTNATVAKPEDFCKVHWDPRYQLACSNFALVDKHPTNPRKDYWRDFISEKQ